MQIGRKIIRLESVDSTNNYTANLLNKGELTNGTVIMADDQFAGKGQRGAEWLTKPGENLTFSFFLDNVNLSVQKQFYLTCIISNILIDLLCKIGLKAKIKWPNDIYINRKKIAGILIENQLSGSMVKSVIIGIGLNVNQLNFEDLIATSIYKETNERKNPMDILFSFIEEFNSKWKNFSESNFNEVKSNYLKNLFQINEIGFYEDSTGNFEGKIINVLDSGHIEIEKGNNVLHYDLKEIKFKL